MKPDAAVLHAEDDRNDAFFMQLAFGEAGLANRLFQVPNGWGVIDYLEGNPPYADRARYPFPSLLLLDLKMPGMDGFKVLEWRREHPAFAGLPTVVLSASDDAGDREQAQALGASEYRLKPLAFSELVELVRELHERWLVPEHASVEGRNP
ncbi:MAG TPA: response regulator [Tepidisphaeraceae bacterium]|nr:response regulator [Tepidisphaeraceae bacterium]